MPNTSTVSFSSPSNIAFIKYWGKFGRQLPMNPSISMTLSNCVSKCSVEFELDSNHIGISSFEFEGVENQAFRARLEKFLVSICDIYPLANKLSLKIKSENTFPHSAGIASSASAMSAFCACLVEIEQRVVGGVENIDQRISMLSRLASGSACRSVFSHYAYWGESRLAQLKSSNEYALEFHDFHDSFKEVMDSILIVSSEEKSVSSSQGHILMNGHPFKDARIEQAHENFTSIMSAMKTGDWDHFGEVLENEALTLHALMMSSYPSFILLKPNSLLIIEKVRAYRELTSDPLYFTIDAGPNIHLIYPASHAKSIKDFINTELSPICDQGRVIHDSIGPGKIQLQ